MSPGTPSLGQGRTLMSRAPLASLATTSRPGRPSRGLSRGSPVGALVVAPWAGRPRRRDGETALAAPSEALAALGVSPPPRSTRAAANERRPAALDPCLWATGDARCQARAPGPGLRCQTRALPWTARRARRACPGSPGRVSARPKAPSRAYPPGSRRPPAGLGGAARRPKARQRQRPWAAATPAAPRGPGSRRHRGDGPLQPNAGPRGRGRPPASQGHLAGDGARGGELAPRRDLGPPRRPARAQRPSRP